MAKRHNHYEAAFEALLRERRLPYVAVDETRRCLVQPTGETGRSLVQQSGAKRPDLVSEQPMGGGSLKSVDFLVSPPGGESLIIDIKGRQFPSGSRQRQYWRNWSTRDDLKSLAEWARYFGEGFTPILLFAFQLTADRSPVPPADLWQHKGRTYGFVGIGLADYWIAARTLSAKWDTLAMPAAEFRHRASSWRAWLASEDYLAASADENPGAVSADALAAT